METFSATEINGHAIVDSLELSSKFKMDEKNFLHNEGDSFDTIDDTALAFGLIYNPLSVAKTDKFPAGREYGALIYDESTKDKTIFAFCNVTLGDEKSVKLAIPDKNKKLAATIHTHAAYRSKHDFISDNFSGGDGLCAISTGVPIYGVTPGGYLKVLSHNWKSRPVNAIPDNDPAVRIIATGLPQ